MFSLISRKFVEFIYEFNGSCIPCMKYFDILLYFIIYYFVYDGSFFNVFRHFQYF